MATGRADAAAAVLDEHRVFFAEHPGLGTSESMTLATAAVAAEADTGTAARAAAAAVHQATSLDHAWFAAEAADLLALARLRSGDVDGGLAAARETTEWAERIGHRGLVCRAVFTATVAERMRGGGPSDAVHGALAEAARLGLRPLVADGLEIVAALAADAAAT
jgi:hypothetical protein